MIKIDAQKHLILIPDLGYNTGGKVEMNNQKSLLQKGAILSISLMLTSSQAINGVIPQMKQSSGYHKVKVNF